jgi:hypothetical protein
LATEVDQPGDRIGSGSPRAAIDLGATNGVEDASLCRFIDQCHNPFLKLQKFQGGIIDSSLNINEGIADSVNIVTGGHEKNFPEKPFNHSSCQRRDQATGIVARTGIIAGLARFEQNCREYSRPLRSLPLNPHNDSTCFSTQVWRKWVETDRKSRYQTRDGEMARRGVSRNWLILLD